MTDINAVGTLTSTSTLREFAQQSFKRSSPEGLDPLADRVEISEVAAFLSQLAELPESRARKIVDIRNSIQNGTYQIDEKLDQALDQILNAL